MGGGRAPCCDKSKVKRGPWSPAEDMRLITFIQKNGHPNWRSLPKQAGLLRCGKSCRLRWINYLRPDVKRGNFTPEEEDLIIKLHDSMGNRWSKIASLLPGRTDNEIKNVWNTHLKKKSERNKIGNGNAVSGLSPASSSSCSSADADHQQQHSFSKEDQVTSSSSSTSSSATTTEEELMWNSTSSSDQGVVDNSMVYHGEEGGILEIPPSSEEDIEDIWSMLDDLDKELAVVPVLNPNNVDLEVPLQSSINDGVVPELGGEADYTKWLRYFENELQIAVLQGGATETSTSSTSTAYDDQLQIEPPSSCCNLGEFPFISWPPNSSPHHNFGF